MTLHGSGVPRGLFVSRYATEVVITRSSAPGSAFNVVLDFGVARDAKCEHLIFNGSDLGACFPCERERDRPSERRSRGRIKPLLGGYTFGRIRSSNIGSAIP